MSQIEAVAFKHLEYLSARIGSRPLGSRRNQAAAEYVQNVFKDNGLETTRQEIPCPVWEDLGTRLELDGKMYAAAANVFSPPCDVAARAAAVGTLAELQTTELTGRIGILYGALTAGGGYSAQGAFYFPERDQAVVRLLAEKKPAAIITVNPQFGSLQRLISDCEFPISSATVPAEVGLVLLRQIDQTLRLQIESYRAPSRFANVVGRHAGARRERIVLCAHLDTMTDAPGAIDNGSGVAAMLALAETLTPQKLPVGLEFIALNAHENGGIGIAEYLRQRENELAQVIVAINIDGVGQALGANSIAVFAASPSFQDQIAVMLKKYPGVARVDPWYESDHTAFVSRGVPSVAVSSIGVTNVMHSPIDTVEWVSAAKLGEAASLVAEIVASLQDKSTDWCRAQAA